MLLASITSGFPLNQIAYFNGISMMQRLAAASSRLVVAHTSSRVQRIHMQLESTVMRHIFLPVSTQPLRPPETCQMTRKTQLPQDDL